MQRLTWDGIALHAGGLPGYPASYGCVRLPLAFSEALFGATPMGMTVVITGETPTTQNLVDPRTLLLGMTAAGTRPTAHAAAAENFQWQPELSPAGPLTILASFADQRAIVMRNGVIIGRAQVTIPKGRIIGTQAAQFTRFDQNGHGIWFYIGVPGPEGESGKPLSIVAQHDVVIPPKFFQDVRAILVPGVTLVLAESSISGGGEGTKLTVMASV